MEGPRREVQFVEKADYGEYELSPSTKIKVKKMAADGREYIDIRKHITSGRFTGPAKGITVPPEKYGEFVDFLAGLKAAVAGGA